MCVQAEAVADYLRETRKLKVGVVNLTCSGPSRAICWARFLKGKKGVAVLERTDQPLSEDLPLMREVRATVSKCLENGAVENDKTAGSALSRLRQLCQGQRHAAPVFRLLRPGFARPATGRLVAAIENMLPGSAHRKFFYLSIDFVRDQAANPKQEIHQQDILAAYPKIKELALKGSENPNLMPKGAIAVRMHSVGGWGAVTTGKNLAMTLFELLGWDIKANPKYGSEKKGQPTTYFLSAAPEPIRVNCEYTQVDVVLSPDPQVFLHTNAVAGLKKGGVFIIQSNLPDAAALWATFPMHTQKAIVDNDIHVFYLDAFSIAREESSNPDLQLRMQGNAFQGAFFHASGVQERAGLNEETLFKAIENQLQHKFGKQGQARGGRQPARGQARLYRNPRNSRRGEAGRRAPAGRFQTDPGTADHAQALAQGEGGLANRRYASLLGTDRQFLYFRQGLRQPGRSVHGSGADPGRHRRLSRHDADPFRASGVDRRELHRLRQLLHRMSGLGDSRPGLDGRRRAEHRHHQYRNGRPPTRFLRKGVRAIEKKLRGVLDKDGLDVRALLKRSIDEAMHEDPNQGNAAMEEEYHLLESRSANSSSPPPSRTGPTRRRRPRAAAACSRSPSIPTPARAARCASRSARTMR
jgi:pyruvate-ferredoxin/flavodoxin oxidoreductase